MTNSSFKNIYDDLFNRCHELQQSNHKNWCCIVIDIEQFRLFNEIYGRDKGDLLLASYTDVLSSINDEVVSIYLGSDNYVLFMEYNFALIEKIEKRLIKETRKITTSRGYRPAIGICRLEVGEEMSFEIYDRAVLAMRDAKADRKVRIKLYNPNIHATDKTETKLLVDIKNAFKNNEITFYLQPQCRISNRKIVGAEALARWIKKDGTMISPGSFIPVLEKKGFIADFDVSVWELVVKWISSTLDRGLNIVPISINVSQIDIITIDVAKHLSDLCDRYRVPHRYLKVEITETSFANEYELVHKLVHDLRLSGFMVLMDDFGSGYSSLNMLEQISVDVIKLDMSFINQGSTNTRKGITIIESIFNMTRMMSLPLVVEGVETKEQVDFLNSLGCRYVQGYHFYRPMPIHDFESLLHVDLLDCRGFINKKNEQFHIREFLDENTFTDTMLNNVLGAVAFYTLEDMNLSITRFNQQFYKMIGDPLMETRQLNIQNFVVTEDHGSLYRTLEEAENKLAEGSSCEIRFYKSDGGVFWFRIHFFYLKNEQNKKIFYGQIEDVTEIREQSIQFLEMLRGQSETAMMMNLDRNIIQYVPNGNALSKVGLPSMELKMSNKMTSQRRFNDDNERRRFLEFFNADRLRDSHQHGVYHETITLNFILKDKPEPVEFSTYYIRWTKDQELVVYVFGKRVNQ